MVFTRRQPAQERKTSSSMFLLASDERGMGKINTMTSFTTPVIFIVFSRPDSSRMVFHAIARQRPSRLLIIADGPRLTRPGEPEACQQVRDIVAQVDWRCEVSTNFSPTNMGCRKRIISGLNWAFSLVNEAIILEDDCLPDPSFFPFCHELLGRYRDDNRVSMIAGTNLAWRATPPSPSYFFSRVPHIWGWATWRRAWSLYDEHLSQWPAIRASGLLEQAFSERRLVRCWTKIFDQMHAGTGPNTWDYQWSYTNIVHNSLIAVPRTNLITNIGFGPGATHTLDADPDFVLPSAPIEFPLVHPPAMIPMRSLDHLNQRLSFPTFPKRLRLKVHNLRRRALGLVSFASGRV
jgi:hypothetical protein